MHPAARRVLIALLIALSLPAVASADRKYFVRTYTPYLAPAGSLELETWLTARTGKADGSHTSWEQRVEFEYAVSDRLTGAAYLNFSQAGGEESGLHFDSPSIEFIWTLAEQGRLVGDPALYIEVSETGQELEVETKLLLAHRRGRLVGALDLVSELEFRHNDEELLPTGEALSNQLATELTAGLTREIGPHVALGLEARYRGEYPNFGRRAAAIVALGPTLNLQSGNVQLALSVQPQVWGTPAAGAAHRNLDAFEKSQVRAVLGIEL